MTEEQIAEFKRLMRAKKLAEQAVYKKKFQKAKRDAKKQD
jgi:hypothetical protein